THPGLTRSFATRARRNASEATTDPQRYGDGTLPPVLRLWGNWGVAPSLHYCLPVLHHNRSSGVNLAPGWISGHLNQPKQAWRIAFTPGCGSRPNESRDTYWYNRANVSNSCHSQSAEHHY